MSDFVFFILVPCINFLQEERVIQRRYYYQQERNGWDMGGTSSNIIREEMGDTGEVLLSTGEE